MTIIFQKLEIYGKGPGMFSDAKIMDMANKLKFELRFVFFQKFI